MTSSHMNRTVPTAVLDFGLICARLHWMTKLVIW